MAEQPVGLINSNGVLVTIGFVVNNDRAALVLPMATEDTSDLNDVVIVGDAVQSVTNSLITGVGFKECISSGCYIAFVSGEGMTDGKVPRRDDYTPDHFPGIRGANPLPSNVAALMGFYAEPGDLPSGKRMRIGKNFIPGISRSDAVGDLIVDELQTAIDNLAQALQSGIPSVIAGSQKWYRVLGLPLAGTPPKPSREPNLDVIRCATGGSRHYLCTQRRRLIPRV